MKKILTKILGTGALLSVLAYVPAKLTLNEYLVTSHHYASRVDVDGNGIAEVFYTSQNYGDTMFVEINGNKGLLRGNSRGRHFDSVNCGYPLWTTVIDQFKQFYDFQVIPHSDGSFEIPENVDEESVREFDISNIDRANFVIKKGLI